MWHDSQRIERGSAGNTDGFHHMSASDAILLNLVVPDGPGDRDAYDANRQMLNLCAGQNREPAEQPTA
jgi:hypothetical protein